MIISKVDWKEKKKKENTFQHKEKESWYGLNKIERTKKWKKGDKK